jgi:hypothetical protein
MDVGFEERLFHKYYIKISSRCSFLKPLGKKKKKIYIYIYIYIDKVQVEKNIDVEGRVEYLLGFVEEILDLGWVGDIGTDRDGLWGVGVGRTRARGVDLGGYKVSLG